MPDTGNWHGWTLTSWNAALSAAPAPAGRQTKFHGVIASCIPFDQQGLVALKRLSVRRSVVLSDAGAGSGRPEMLLAACFDPGAIPACGMPDRRELPSAVPWDRFNRSF